MSYISREAAIKALQEKVFHNLTDEFYGTMQVLDEIPAADVVEVKHGVWILNPDDTAGCGFFVCSSCKCDVYDQTDFCPNCGADMRGEMNE